MSIPRRRRRSLERTLGEAVTDTQRAKAHFDLAVFHDNNNREPEAVPHYRDALRLGLRGKEHSEALAWLASSLHKTGRQAEAKECVRQAREVSVDERLMRFLDGLEKRIGESLR